METTQIDTPDPEIIREQLRRLVEATRAVCGDRDVRDLNLPISHNGFMALVAVGAKVSKTVYRRHDGTGFVIPGALVEFEGVAIRCCSWSRDASQQELDAVNSNAARPSPRNEYDWDRTVQL